MGGGRKSFNANSTSKMANHDVTDKNLCIRNDSRDLIKEWIRDKEAKQLSYQYLANLKDIKMLDAEHTDYILGKYTIFLPDLIILIIRRSRPSSVGKYLDKNYLFIILAR